MTELHVKIHLHNYSYKKIHSKRLTDDYPTFIFAADYFTVKICEA